MQTDADEMLAAEFGRVCRLCGAVPPAAGHGVFDKDDAGQQPVQMILQTLPLIVYRNDPLPKTICADCHADLNRLFKFRKKCCDTHDDFKMKLAKFASNERARMYLNMLEYDLPEEYRAASPRKTMRDFSAQTQPPSNNLKILTVKRINEINGASESSNPASPSTESRTFLKAKRRIGPKSKVPKQPASLLQTVLDYFNRSVVEEQERCDEVESTDDGASSYGSAEYNSLEPEVNITELPDHDYYGQFSLLTEAAVESNDSNDDVFEYVDYNVPATCNYCMKTFPNIVALSKHEVQHILVDIGPRVDRPEFGVRYRKVVYLYNGYKARMLQRRQREEQLEQRRLQLQAHRQQQQQAMQHMAPAPSPAQQHFLQLQQQQHRHQQQLAARHSQILRTEIARKVATENDGTSQLVHSEHEGNHEFALVNGVVTVDGRPLKDIDKHDRRFLYKTVVFDGIKRRFCTICRHTFKDNWAIEHHYLNDTCRYTCRYCGIKFKFHKDLYDEHMRTHEGEPCNKIFGPRNKRYRNRRRTYFGSPPKTPRAVPMAAGVSRQPQLPQRRPIQQQQHHLAASRYARPLGPHHLHHHQQQQQQQQQQQSFATSTTTNAAASGNFRIKQEVVDDDEEEEAESGGAAEDNGAEPPNQAVTLVAKGTEKSRAYFCRKCFKVFFQFELFNRHSKRCNGTRIVNDDGLDEEDEEASRGGGDDDEDGDADADGGPRRSSRPVRKCVRNPPVDADYEDPTWQQKQTAAKASGGGGGEGWECGICCSSFPSRHSRNSHMRVHKDQLALQQQQQQQLRQEAQLNRIAAQSHAIQRRHQHQQQQQQQHRVEAAVGGGSVRLGNLDPAVARLIQNNPHLSIRSYEPSASRPNRMQPQPQQQQQQQQLVPEILNVSSLAETELGSGADGEQQRSYKCADCSLKFENKSLLYYHKINDCVVKKNYECGFCRKKFGSKEQYNTHMFYVHPE